MAKANIWDPLFYRNSNLLEQIVESASEGVWVIGMDGRTIYANPAALTLLGTTREHLLASHAFDFVPIEDRAHARAQFERCLAQSACRWESRLVRPDSRVFWASISTSLYCDDAGSPIGLLGYLSDITQQRSTEAALLQAEDRLRLAIDAAQLGTFNCDLPLAHGTFVWNDTVRRQHFVSLDESPSLTLFFSRLHPDDRDRIARALENAARHRAIYDVEYRVLAPQTLPPQTRWIRAIGRHVYDSLGTPVRIDGITIDITDRKLLENALREEGRATHTLYALSKKLVTEFDLESLVHTITEAGRLLTGAALSAFFHRVQEDAGDFYLLYSLSGSSHRHFDQMPVPQPADIFGPAFLAQGAVRIGDIRTDPRGKSELLHHVLGPEDHPIRSFLAVPVVSRFGHVIGGLCCGHPDPDKFSERDERSLAGIASHAAIAIDNARLLNEARQANAAKDKFLAVLSHELRTPLNPVLLTASMMAADPALPESARTNIEMIRRNVELEGRLIDDLLDITRIARGRIDLQPTTVDVHTLLQQAVDMVQQEILARRQIICLDLSAQRHHVYGDAARLQQVWSNLMRNAIKFTPAEGTITIRTRIQRPTGVERRQHSPVTPAEMIAVDVIDSGMGIQPDQIDRLFRPFEQGDESIGRRFGGLGLGLAISHSLMEIHNGSLSASSEGVDRGATFTTLLPTVPAPPAVADAMAPVTGGTGANLQILLVEDHLDTARTMARLLTMLGHRPTVAHSIAEALSAAAEQHFDLLICDIGLPDGSGLDLLGRFAQGDSPAHAVALTGYGMEEDVQRSRDAGFEEHLTKPLNFDRIVALLQKVAADTCHPRPTEPPPTYQI